MPLPSMTKQCPSAVLEYRDPTLQCQVHQNIDDFQPHVNLLPTADQVSELQTSMIWHIKDILLNVFPDIHQCLKGIYLSPPMDLAIPVHKTEQYPLPAALIHELTIDGTLNIIDHIFFCTLGPTEDEIKKNGPFLSAGGELVGQFIGQTKWL
jgi:hypothetical protein